MDGSKKQNVLYKKTRDFDFVETNFSSNEYSWQVKST